ncbi:MAG: glycogen-binding domain-containing protein [Spirochaetia bacterium]|nr:glycogen-binding domain-containing protein [Spirochaetota bacterium]MDW8112362.1 glycogen-binding domain-containing protein [Spirochaetia bacterium]
MKVVRLISISIAMLISLSLLSSCLLWDVLKDRYIPYEVVGKDPETGKLIVKFTFDRPAATTVHLAGQFNSWTAPPSQGTPGTDNVPIEMKKDEKTGYWTVEWKIRPGRWQYKYVIDGGVVWSEDQANPLKENDGFGGYNSVAILSE